MGFRVAGFRRLGFRGLRVKGLREGFRVLGRGLGFRDCARVQGRAGARH